MMSSITAALIGANVFLLMIVVAGWTLAFTVAPGAITMAIGGTIVAIPFLLLLVYSAVIDHR